MSPTEQAEPAASTGYIEVALIIFFVVFLAIVAKVVFTKSSRYRDAAQIPLSDDEVVTPRDDDSGDRT